MTKPFESEDICPNCGVEMDCERGSVKVCINCENEALEPKSRLPLSAIVNDTGLKYVKRLERLNANLVAALEGIRNQVTVYPDGNAFSRNQTVKTIDNIAEAALAKAKEVK